ncbi:MAG: chemotaxis protein CheD [Desulfovibrionaceae bacterium]|nr:chemotaxis protein CheD [Desulfovibrionaceae bacterium]
MEQVKTNQHYLKACACGLFEGPARVSTVLGSCVAVTFHDLELGLGAIFHALLPRSAELEPQGLGASWVFRYVDSSIRFLAARFEALGLERRNIQVKVFGGANLLSRAGSGPWPHCVGQRNAEVAFAELKALGFRVKAHDVGGRQGRKIIFSTADGEVLLKRIHNGPPARV